MLCVVSICVTHSDKVTAPQTHTHSHKRAAELHRVAESGDFPCWKCAHIGDRHTKPITFVANGYSISFFCSCRLYAIFAHTLTWHGSFSHYHLLGCVAAPVCCRLSGLPQHHCVNWQLHLPSWNNRSEENKKTNEKLFKLLQMWMGLFCIFYIHSHTAKHSANRSIKGDKRSGAISNDAINNNRTIEMQLWSIFFHSLPLQKAFTRIQLLRNGCDSVSVGNDLCHPKYACFGWRVGVFDFFFHSFWKKKTSERKEKKIVCARFK